MHCRLLLIAALLSASVVLAQDMESPSYDIGTPVVQDIWVNPIGGNDGNSGNTSNQALRTITAAWNRIPQGQTLTNTGYRVRLLPGSHTSIPNYWESRYGTALRPIIFQAEGAPGSAVLPDPNIFDCRYLYFIGIHFDKPFSGGDAFHLEQCQNILLRNCTVSGHTFAQETIKVNQSQHIYIEDCDIYGAGDNAIDFVAVQYGHIVRSKIHDAADWVLYVKGGSAYITIDGNEVYDSSGNGGITAGQGTGFEFMTNPWLHYEAYDIKIVNNLIHDTYGAGLGVNGGYNILMAYNTLVRVGRRSHVIEVVHGRRGCDGDPAACESNRVAGGWGTAGAESQYIPNRNVYIFNNIVYNPAPYQSEWQHFAIAGNVTPPRTSNVASPAAADDNLRICGNLIWNGPQNLSVLGDSSGCQNGNPTCNEAQLLANNQINTLFPQFVNASNGDFRPAITGNIFNAVTYPIPAFPGGDRPAPPVQPTGVLDNTVPHERTGYPRYARHRPPGAYTGGSSMRMEQIAPDTVGLRAERGYRYAIDASSDVKSWAPVAVMSNATETLLQVPVSATNEIRHYRARLLPP